MAAVTVTIRRSGQIIERVERPLRSDAGGLAIVWRKQLWRLTDGEVDLDAGPLNIPPAEAGFAQVPSSSSNAVSPASVAPPVALSSLPNLPPLAELPPPPDDQAERDAILAADAHTRMLVEAGPGTGKTQMAALRLSALIRTELSPGQMLVLSFSRSAVRTLTRRLAIVAQTDDQLVEELRHVSIRTFDSWAFRILRLLGEEPAKLLSRGHDANIAALTAAIGSPRRDDVRRMIGDRRHLIVDEFQDLPGVRGELVLQLLDLLAPPGEPDGCGFTILGDPVQAIFGFAAGSRKEGPFPTPLEYWAKVRSLYGDQLELRTLRRNYRSDAPLAALSAELRNVLLGTLPDDEKLQQVRARIAALPVPDGELAPAWLDNEAKSKAVLTRTNGEALELHVRRRIDGDRQILTVTLINRSQEADDRLRDELCLFQTGLIVTIADKESQGAIHPRAVLPPAGGDEDAQSAALLYRHAVEYAVGHGVAVEWDPPEDKRVRRVASTWLPQIAVRGMSADGHPSLSSFSEQHPEAFRADWLARPEARAEVTGALDAFALTYRNWISTELEARLATFPGDLGIAASLNLRRCCDAAGRIERGIATLRQSDVAWRAFALANEAMDRQARYESKRERAAPLVWRPFQLAYILLVLPGLVDPDDDDRDCVDLLWFPTGGGKTEAYLGLTAFQIFMRRLTSGARRGSGGVDVLMRYTLRLLTVQQFQRAAALICACDSLREENDQLGTAPISLGLYVGGDATPKGQGAACRCRSHDQASGLGDGCRWGGPRLHGRRLGSTTPYKRDRRASRLCVRRHRNRRYPR